MFAHANEDADDGRKAWERRGELLTLALKRGWWGSECYFLTPLRGKST